MATESRPASGAISGENYTWASAASVLAATSEATLFPASKLRTTRRSERHRSVGKGTHKIDFDLGSSRLVRAFGLVDSNITSSVSVILWGAGTYAELGGTSGSGVKHSFTSYTQDELSKLLLWYVGTNDAGTLSDGARTKQYWRVEIASAGTLDDQYEIGAVWLGTYVDVRLAFDTGRDYFDQSPTVRVAGGGRFTDPIRTGRNVGFSAKAQTQAEAEAVETALASVVGKTPVIVDPYARATDTTRKARSSMLGVIAPSSGLQWSHPYPNRYDLRFRFVEELG